MTAVRDTIPKPPGEDATETEFQKWIIKVAKERGWRYSHTYRALMADGQWRTTASVGFPDLLLVRDGRLVFIEVKSKTGRVEPAQGGWLDALAEIPCAEVWVVDARQWRDVAVVLT